MVKDEHAKVGDKHREERGKGKLHMLGFNVFLIIVSDIGAACPHLRTVNACMKSFHCPA